MVVLIFNAVIVRFSGEIAIKSKGVRSYWLELLTDRMRKACNCDVLIEDLRAFLITDRTDEAISKLRFIFGLSSFSPAVMTDISYDDIIQAAIDIIEKRGNVVRSFGIFIEKNLSNLSSDELKSKLVNEIKNRLSLTLDLKSPDIPIFIEIRRERAFIFTEKIPGPGGLPLGTQDDLVVMFSGGPDSSLAAWYAMRRGSHIILVYLDHGGEPLRSEALERVLKGAERLSLWGGVWKLYVIDFDPVIKAMRERVPEKVIYILFKRYMMRVGRLVAKLEGASGIVTGEIIGEQASQTIRNLAIITEASGADMPVFRPVLCMDKDEVLKKLKEIDEKLFRTASRSIEPCKFLTTKPKMDLSLNSVQMYEKRVGITDSLLKKLIREAKIIEF